MQHRKDGIANGYAVPVNPYFIRSQKLDPLEISLAKEYLQGSGFCVLKQLLISKTHSAIGQINGTASDISVFLQRMLHDAVVGMCVTA